MSSRDFNAAKKYGLSQKFKNSEAPCIAHCYILRLSQLSFLNCFFRPFINHKNFRGMSHMFFPTIRHVHLINPQDYARSIDHRSNFYRADVRH